LKKFAHLDEPPPQRLLDALLPSGWAPEMRLKGHVSGKDRDHETGRELARQDARTTESTLSS
jgi:hypothetical protein